VPFIKKYIYYAKRLVTPVLTDAASEHVQNTFVRLRSETDQKTLPITIRTVETLIRLATAHAKCRLSNVVEEVTQ
jgi:DNA replication licensing factor MCM3